MKRAKTGSESRPTGALEGKLFDVLYGFGNLTSPGKANSVIDRIMPVIRENSARSKIQGDGLPGSQVTGKYSR